MRQRQISVVSSIVSLFLLIAAGTGRLSAQVTLVPNASPSSNSPGTIVSLTGSNFPAGTIIAAAVTVKLQPAVANTGPTVQVAASNIVTIIGSTRRVVFTIPGSLVVAAPTNYLASISGTTSTNLAFSSAGAGSALTINPPFAISGVNPGIVDAGHVALINVTTAFGSDIQGVTQASLGAGISTGGAAQGAYGPVQVTTTNTFTASLSVDPGAASGARTLTVANGAHQASLNNAIVVNNAPSVNAGVNQIITLPAGASLSGTASDDGFPLGAILTIQWSVFSGPGTVQFTNANALSTTATFSTAGTYVLTLTVGDTRLSSSSNVNITVNPPVPTILSVNPNTGQQGQNLSKVAITGQSTNFVNGTTVADFGPGITVNSTSVTDSTHASANITILVGAGLGGRTVTMTTNTEIAQLANAFDVTAGTPVVLSATPNQGQQGQNNLKVDIVGQFTHFVNGTTAGNLGAGITVNSTSVTDATHASVNISIDAGATTGGRTVTMTTSAEQALLNNGFTVNASGGTQAASVQVTLSAALVAPDDPITVTAVALDSGGNPINNPAFTFNIAITPNGPTSGNAPVIQGNQISFPRVVKALLNQNTSVDPDGVFTDADPSDPNFGQETGGAYTVTATLNGTQLSGNAGVTVLPTGTAAITVETMQYADSLNKVLAEGTAALQNGSAAAIAQAQTDFNNAMSNSDFSFDVLSATQVLAPPNGRLVTTGMLLANGFTPGPDDSSFGSTLNSIHTAILGAINRLSLINPAAISQSDVTALQTAADTYKNAVQQLNGLNPSAIGVTQQNNLLNTIIGTDIPKLLDAIQTLGNGVFSQALLVAKASPQRSRTLAWSSPRVLGRTGIARFQFLTFFTTMFSIMTDLAGTAKGNIIELAVSLMNDIINLEAARLINQGAPGSLTIDLVAMSASLSFSCPNYPQTFIQGQDYDLTPSNNRVALIGCIDSQAIRNIVTLSQPKDLAAAIRLINKVFSIAKAFARNQSVADVEIPDQVIPDAGLLDETDSEMDFFNGFARVNQGRIPCVGLLIVANFKDGSYAATNPPALLPSCP